MVILSISGNLISGVRQSKTANGVDCSTFFIQSEDEGSLPLIYTAVAFGKIGARAVNELRHGSVLSCFGRLSAGGPEKKISLTVSGFEVLAGAADGK
jgi:hypothetical protein